MMMYTNMMMMYTEIFIKIKRHSTMQPYATMG